MSELISLIGITRDQANQWMKLGVFKPSKKKGSGRGGSKNLFSLLDVYQATIFRSITESGAGWKRDMAIDMMRAIDRKDLSFVIAAGMFGRGDHIKFAVIEKLLGDNGPVSEQIAKWDVEGFKEKLIAGLLQDVCEDAASFLVFSRHKTKEGDTFLCHPIATDKSKIGSFSSFQSIEDILKIAHSAFVLNIDKLIRELNTKLLTHHLAKVIGVYNRVLNHINALGNKVTKAEFYQNLLSIID